jgi:membrane protease YdiL (CAAX protease family)
VGTAAGVAWVMVRAVVIFFAWQVVSFAFLQMPPAYAVTWLMAVALLFVRMYAVPGWLSDRTIASARPRPVPQEQRLWLLALVPVLMVLPVALTIFFMALGLVQSEDLPEVLRRYAERPGGTAVLLLVIVGMAPLFEEFAFRGWMQRPLERRLGPGPAIGLTSIVFALMHFEAEGIPIRMIAGVVLGYTVWVTRSIWTGVALHAVWNGGVIALSGFFVDAEPTGRGWSWAAPAAVVAALCLAAFGWVAARMRAGAVVDDGHDRGHPRYSQGAAGRSGP